MRNARTRVFETRRRPRQTVLGYTPKHDKVYLAGLNMVVPERKKRTQKQIDAARRKMLKGGRPPKQVLYFPRDTGSVQNPSIYLDGGMSVYGT